MNVRFEQFIDGRPTAGVGATMKAAQIEEGSTVAIFGLGTVGLAVALVLAFNSLIFCSCISNLRSHLISLKLIRTVRSLCFLDYL